MADYKTYTFEDVFNTLSLVYSVNWGYTKVRGSKNEYYTTCPECGHDNCSLNFNKGLGRCFGSKKVACDKTWNPATFGAAIVGESTKDFDHVVRSYLNGDSYNKKSKSKVQYKKRNIEVKDEEQCILANDNVLNDTYSSLLSHLSLTERDYRDLKLRGFLDDEIQKLNYKSYAEKTQDACTQLVDKIINDGKKLDNVPGFYKLNGKWTIAKNLPVVMIPVRNEKGLIVGMQQRKHNEDVNEAKKIKKMGWLSSNGANMAEGTKRPVVLHYATTFVNTIYGEKRPFFKNDIVYFTEGPMKADIIHLLEGVGVIAIPGVQNRKLIASNFEYFKSIGVKKFVDYLDMDYVTNKTVADQLEKLKKEILDAGFEYERNDWDVNIPNSQKKLKGRDDFLMYHMRNIIPQ